MENTIETDLLIVGSGGGGMTAAIFAHEQGLSPMIIEKSPHCGGSTALSGGAIWIPANHLMEREGVEDSLEAGETYIHNAVGDHSSPERRSAYIQFGHKMVKELEAKTHVQLRYCKGYADYFPFLEGGHPLGRSLEALPFDVNELGEESKTLNPPIWPAPGGINLTAGEYNKINVMRSTLAGKKALLNVIGRKVGDLLLRKNTVCLGQALVGRLRLSLQDRNIPLLLNTAFKAFRWDAKGTIVGVEAEKDGERILIQAKKGVLLAAGGFAANLKMRKKYLPFPASVDATNAHKGNTGDAILAAQQLKVGLDLMEDAWWGPCSILPDGRPFFHVGERSLPGAIIVNKKGKRFVNEAAPYTEFIHQLIAQNSSDNDHLPFFFIMDNRFRKKYPFGLMPAGITGKKYLESGYITQAKTLEELARKMGIDPEQLQATVQRFNAMAEAGTDTDFHKGENEYDRYYGDPTVTPNPCLFPLQEGPFYAVKLFPGDLGTKGGITTDEFARALDEQGQVIPNLYATGNCSASVMGNSYPGAGATIGPSMVFGYIAALHAAGQLVSMEASREMRALQSPPIPVA